MRLAPILFGILNIQLIKPDGFRSNGIAQQDKPGDPTGGGDAKRVLFHDEFFQGGQANARRAEIQHGIN